MRYVVFEFVFSYGVFFGSDPGSDQVEALADLAGGFGASLLLALFVARASARIASEDPRRALQRGALTGVISVALLNGAVALWFPPVDPAEIALHLPAALCGGLVGGAYGRRRYAAAIAAHRARLAIARARRPEEVAAAIGENLTGGMEKAGTVLLWRVPPGWTPDRTRDEEQSANLYELLAVWPARKASSWPLGLRLAQETARGLALVPEGAVRTESVTGLPRDLRLLLPHGRVSVVTLSTGGAPVGLLMIGAKRWAWSSKRACLEAAPLAAQQLTIFRQEILAERSGARVERERLADEIHDTVIQGCIAIGNRIEDVGGIERLDADDRKELGLALKISRDTVEEARLFVRALNTDDFSEELPRLLAAEAEAFADEADVRVRATTEGTPYPLPPDVGMVLFKATREGLANVRRHASASTVDVVLAYGSGRVSLEIHDDGVGLGGAAQGGMTSATTNSKPHLAVGGHGLKAMRRLARNAGGSLSLEVSPSGGTSLSVRFEVEPANTTTPTSSAADCL